MLDVEVRSVPFLYMSYPVTPDVTCPDTDGSVEAVHERLIWLDDIAVAERFVGIEGGVVSGVGGGGVGGIAREQEAFVPPLLPLHCQR